MTTIDANVETITPEIAEQLLAKNTHNRNVKTKNLQKVVRAIRNGEWELNGEAIKVATDGTILDGQHRLMAVIETNTAIETLVIRGLEAKTQETMDGGSPRNAGDVLKLRGHANSVTLSSIAKKIAVCSEYDLRRSMNTNAIVTTQEIINAAETTPGITDIVHLAMRVSSATGMSASIAGVLIYAFQEIDTEDADYFFEKLITGEMLQKGDPIYALRNALAEVKSIRGKKSATWVAAVAVKAWNKYRDGESAAFLKFLPGGSRPEPFPEPR